MQHTGTYTILTLTAFVLLTLAVFLFTPGVTNAQCPMPGASGPIKVNHAVCIPPGPGICTGNPKLPGRDLCPCPVSGQQGGSITGICMGGCCKLQSASGPPGGMPMLPMIPMGMPKMMMPMMMPFDNFFSPFENSTSTSFLDTTGGLLNTITDALGFSDVFGSNDNQEADETGTLDDAPPADPNAPSQEGDTVTTTYEYAEAVAETPIVGGNIQSDTFGAVRGPVQDPDDFEIGDDGDFDNDFFGASLDSGDGSVPPGGLSRELLEAQGLLEAARFGSASSDTHSGSLQVPYESLTPAEIRSLQDYHSSAVAVSGRLSPFQGNPLSNDRFTTQDVGAETQNEGPGFFARVVGFFATLLGLGSPAQ